MAVPDTLACYLPYGMYIIFETVSLPVESIIGLCMKPLSLLRWDDSSNTFLHLTEPVSIYNNIIPHADFGVPVIFIFTIDEYRNVLHIWNPIP